MIIIVFVLRPVANISFIYRTKTKQKQLITTVRTCNRSPGIKGGKL